MALLHRREENIIKLLHHLSRSEGAWVAPMLTTARGRGAMSAKMGARRPGPPLVRARPALEAGRWPPPRRRRPSRECGSRARARSSSLNSSLANALESVEEAHRALPHRRAALPATARMLMRILAAPAAHGWRRRVRSGWLGVAAGDEINEEWIDEVAPHVRAMPRVCQRTTFSTRSKRESACTRRRSPRVLLAPANEDRRFEPLVLQLLLG